MKKRIILVFSILVILTILCILFFKKEKKIADFNLLFITLDTTRADSIGIYGCAEAQTPNIDMLGQNGIIFKNCYSPVPLTLPSHCSIFTGRYPITHKVRNNGSYFLNNKELTMAEIFKKNGYQTSAIIASFTLFSKFGLKQGFDLYDESFNSQKMILNFLSEITADRVYDKFIDWLDHHNGEKFFTWVHFFDPHYPYYVHPEMEKKFSDYEKMKYYGEIAFMDHYIGKIVKALEAKNIIDNTLIIIVGDHGEAFGEHNEFGHGIFCYEECIKVPLIFYNPHLFKNKNVINNRVSLVDIFPTVLKLFHLDIPSNVQGKNLVNLIKGKKDDSKRIIFFESIYGKEKNNWATITGIIEDNYKYISVPESELYNLENDLNENINIFEKETERSREMDNKLKKFILQNTGFQEPSKRKLSSSDIKRLKSLGYISAFTSKATKMIDPKKGVIIYAKVEKIREKITKGKYNQAEIELNKLIAENSDLHLPNFYEAHYQILKNKGKESEAISVLQKGLKKFPGHEELAFQLALIFFSKNEWSKTKKLCLKLLENNSLFTGAYILLGDINERMNEMNKAILYFEKALKIESQNELIKTKLIYLLIKNNKFDKAENFLKELERNKSVLRNPAQLEIMSKIGVLFADKNKLERAISILTKISQISPKNPNILVNLGTAYLKHGQVDKALKSYKEALEVDPNFPMVHCNLGMLNFSLYLANNNPETQSEALKNFNRAIHLNPDLGEAYNGRGAVLFSLNEINKAVSDFKKAITFKPDYFDAYINISIAYRQVGNKKEALRYLELYKNKYYNLLPISNQNALDRLISEIQGN